MSETESTSAELRRAEQERDELASALDREHGLLKKAETDRSDLRRRVLALEAELVSARQELEQFRSEFARARANLSDARAEIDAVREELDDAREHIKAQGQGTASDGELIGQLRQELDAVRTARDNLDRELAEARATIRAFVRGC